MITAFPKNLNTRRIWLVDLAACAMAGVVLGVVGPFGSFFNDGPIARIAYWTTVILISGFVMGAGFAGDMAASGARGPVGVGLGSSLRPDR